jgi:hypothetical protein
MMCDEKQAGTKIERYCETCAKNLYSRTQEMTEDEMEKTYNIKVGEVPHVSKQQKN